MGEATRTMLAMKMNRTAGDWPFVQIAPFQECGAVGLGASW